MNQDDESTPQSRELGLVLRGLRVRADYQGNELAKRIKWTPVKVSRVEKGKHRLTDVDATTFAVYCGAVGEELADIIDMARAVQNGYNIKPHGGQMPDMLRQLVIEESSAAHITEFEPIFIPGLAQTEEYARALLPTGQPDATDKDIEGWVQARMGRQGLIKRPSPVQCLFVVHEQALRMPVGSPQIMNEQLLHLLFLDGRPQCEIRVVPTGSGPIGMAGHAFRIMRYVEHGPVVYVATMTASIFHHEKPELDFYRGIFDKIERVALDQARSRDLISRVASEFELMGDGDGDQA
jgi:hypothetical protein